MKYSVFLIFLFLHGLTFAQDNPEREHRIKKSQFPVLQTDDSALGSKIKTRRYYKEVDSSQTTYSIKFKKDKLHYHLNYDAAGNLINSGFRVKEIDIPEETYTTIKSYLSATFEKIKVRGIWQEYPMRTTEVEAEILKKTFQNLMLPGNAYKLLIRAKKNDKRQDYELWFTADGEFTRMRKALPANFDRVLY